MPGRLINRRPSLNGIQKLCDPIFCLLVCKKTIKHIYIYTYILYIYIWRIENMVLEDWKMTTILFYPESISEAGLLGDPHPTARRLQLRGGGYLGGNNWRPPGVKGGNLRNELVEFAKSSKFLLI
jgi:hypothetical protein